MASGRRPGPLSIVLEHASMATQYRRGPLNFVSVPYSPAPMEETPGTIVSKPGPLGVGATAPSTSSLEPRGSATVILKGIRVIRGGSPIRPGPRARADTSFGAAIKGIGVVTLEAVLDYVGPGAHVVPPNLIWRGVTTGAQGSPRATVTKAAFRKFTVSCQVGNITKYCNVYIVGAEPTGYQGDGGTTYADNDHALTPLGIQPCDPATGAHTDNCQIQFTVRPPELIVDGVANLFRRNDIQWDVSRDKRARYWYAIPNASGTPVWTLYDDRGSSWASDDSHDTDEDNNPWDANGHIYGNDAPGDTPDDTSVAYVKKLRMREWVRVAFGGTIGRAGSICSTYQYWHIFRSLVKTGAVWSHSPQFGGNELKAGDPGFGPSPT